jgi:hypothetical protein
MGVVHHPWGAASPQTVCDSGHTMAVLALSRTSTREAAPEPRYGHTWEHAWFETCLLRIHHPWGTASPQTLCDSGHHMLAMLALSLASAR